MVRFWGKFNPVPLKGTAHPCGHPCGWPKRQREGEYTKVREGREETTKEEKNTKNTKS